MFPEYFAIKIILLQFVLGWVIFDRTLTGLLGGGRGGCGKVVAMYVRAHCCETTMKWRYNLIVSTIHQESL